MKNKILSMFLTFMILFISIPKYSFAEENGKVIFITMNRTNLEDMMSIESLKMQSDQRGQIALMNIRGDGGTDDKRSYATIGAGGRASVPGLSSINFEELDKDNEATYQSLTNQVPKGINDITINKSINNNETGSYGSVLGSLGQTLSENDLKVSVIGNSDIIKDDEVINNKNIALIAMDNYGRVDQGNIENINKKDLTMPFGMSTDYERLLEDTKKYYENSDVLFIDLGDTYRLDEYRDYLNEESYDNMKKSIYSNINTYLEAVFGIVSQSDNVYVVSPFVKEEDYKNKERLAPVIKFNQEPKGLLESSTTRREGVIANLDLGVDILNEFGLSNENMIGKSLTRVDSEDSVAKLTYELDKMAAISDIRSDIVNTFVAVVSASWVIGLIAMIFKNRIPNNKKVFKVIKEFIKLGIIMPLALLLSPILNFNTQSSIAMGVVLTTIVLYIIGRLIFKNSDIKQMGLFALATIVLIVVDCITGTNLMENNVMSYDAIVGARYYGVGNEYEGVTIASAIFAMAVLLNYRVIPKWGVIIFSAVILITSAYPGMGANVGGAISESVAYLLFILLIFNIKLDFKKIILLGMSAVVVVAAFAIIDIISGAESHLSLFINQILVEGPVAIIETFTRKIEMNLKLAQTSVWVNILLVGMFIIATLIFKPSKQIMKVSNRYPIIHKGFIASMVGCIVTLLVNDSGIVAASTASIYILIPLLIISINIAIFEEKE